MSGGGINQFGGASINIYNSDGSITANRTVTQAGFSLTFTGGDIGIGVAAVASTRLTVKSSTSTTGSKAFETHSASGFATCTIYGDGTFMSQALSDTSHIFTTFGNSLEVRYNAVVASTFSMQVNGSTVCSFINQANLSRFNQVAGQDWGVYAADNLPYILMDESKRKVAIGASSVINSMLEVTGDVEAIGANNGYISVDRTLGTRKRIYVDNGNVLSENA